MVGFISSYATFIAQDLISPVGGWNFYDPKDLKKLDLNTLLKIDGPAKSSIANMIAGKVRDKEITELNAIKRARKERLKRLRAQEELEDKRAAKKAKQEHMQSEASAQAREELMAQVAESAQKDHSPVGRLLEEKRKLETRYEQTEKEIEKLAAEREKTVEEAHKELDQVFQDESEELLAKAEESLRKNPDQPELREATQEFSESIEREKKSKEILNQMIDSLKTLDDPTAPAASTLRNRHNLIQEMKVTQVLKPLTKYGVITEQAADQIKNNYKAKVQKSHQNVNSVNQELDALFAERKQIKQHLKTTNEAIQKAQGGKSYTPPAATKQAPTIEPTSIRPRGMDTTPTTPGFSPG